jgi:hypothetical protein
MDYQIKEKKDGLHIEATVPAEAHQQLMEELGKCAAGTCSCPSTQYEKMAAIEVVPGPAGVTIDLQAKPGETIDRADIERCLEYTAKQLKP